MTHDLKCNTRCEDKEVYNFSARVFFFLCDFLVVWLFQVCCILSLFRLNRQSTLFDPTVDGMVLDTEK